MPNLAQHKRPIEDSLWNRPETATNNNYIDYDGNKGFAHAKWPCNFTIDLESKQKIEVVRFLLWDGMGKGAIEQDSRKYKFSLWISLDDKDFTRIFSNEEEEEGDNGWFIFRFLNDTYARFVRIHGEHNTANKSFQIVEFQVFDDTPNDVDSLNVQNHSILTGMPDKKTIFLAVDEALSEKSVLIGELEKKAGLLEGAEAKYQEAADLVAVIKKSGDFQEESSNNTDRSESWLIASVVAFVVFIAVIIVLLICGNKWSTSIIKTTAENEILMEYTRFFLISLYVTKAIIISTILFVLTWLLKNYRSEKHNYVVNKHKAMSLAVATTILTKEDYKDVERGNLFIQAMNIVFQHQVSGYSKEDHDSPNVVTQILGKAAPIIENGG